MASRKDINRVKLYCTALSYLGTDASPADEAPDEYGCADTASYIIINAFGNVIKHTVATADLYNQLNTSPAFQKVVDFKFGDIIISPTGMGTKPKVISNGHVGIVGENEEIMSNDSASGMFIQNYTVKTWVARWRTQGGYPIYFFRKL